jgi:hypothetical protein
MILKRCALYPDERVKPCEHEHFYYHGSMPCTGRYACSMCGHTQEEIDADNRKED